MAHASIVPRRPAASLAMGPLITALLDHADRQPKRLAMQCHEVRLSYADLCREITQRMQALRATDPNALTVASDADMPDQVLNALARLGLGFPIVGATSGSIGPAKSYGRSQGSWIKSFVLERVCFAIGAADVVLAHGNLSHSLFFYAVCNALHAGATVACARGFRPDHLLAQATELGATVIYAVPTHLEMMVRHSQQMAVSTVRLVLSSGARFSTDNIASIRRLFPNAAIIDFYGASETSFIALANHTADPDLPAGSVGRPFPTVALRIETEQEIADPPSTLAKSQTGIGRIWVHSEMLFTHYLAAPPASFEERTDQAGRRWLTVGDLGWLNHDGYLFLAGRIDRTVNVSGIKIQPEEIEAALLAHPAVMHAAVMGLPDGLRGERLVAAVQTQSSILAAELIAHLRSVVDRQKIPLEYYTLSQWPMTPSGKTDFAAVRSRIATAATERL